MIKLYDSRKTLCTVPGSKILISLFPLFEERISVGIEQSQYISRGHNQEQGGPLCSMILDEDFPDTTARNLDSWSHPPMGTFSRHN